MLEKLLAVLTTFVLQFERYVDILEDQARMSGSYYTPEPHECKCHSAAEPVCTLVDAEKEEELDLDAALAKARAEDNTTMLGSGTYTTVPAENRGEITGAPAELHETNFGKFSREELFKRVTSLEGKEPAPKTRTKTLIDTFNTRMEQMRKASEPTKSAVNSLGIPIKGADPIPATELVKEVVTESDPFADIEEPIGQADVLRVLRELAVAKGKEVALKTLLNASDGARKIDEIKPEKYRTVYDAAIAAKG